jgi:hypothetical protein
MHTRYMKVHICIRSSPWSITPFNDYYDKRLHRMKGKLEINDL